MQSRYTELAQHVGAWLAGASEDGRPTPVGDGLLEAFPGLSRSELDMALAELAYDGLVTVTGWAEPEPPCVRPSYRLFALADPAVTGHSPRRDAAALARWMLDDPGYADIERLFAATGWSYRRFNPALGLLLRVFGEGRYTQPMPRNLPTRSVTIGSAEQMALRRFVKDSA